eukprot:1159856-Pelagomonas_calceolata.AAC.3
MPSTGKATLLAKHPYLADVVAMQQPLPLLHGKLILGNEFRTQSPVRSIQVYDGVTGLHNLEGMKAASRLQKLKQVLARRASNRKATTTVPATLHAPVLHAFMTYDCQGCKYEQTES